MGICIGFQSTILVTFSVNQQHDTQDENALNQLKRWLQMDKHEVDWYLKNMLAK
jgi:hypothetical protein